MKLENLKEQCPAVPEKIHAMIEHEVKSQIGKYENEDKNSDRNRDRNSKVVKLYHKKDTEAIGESGKVISMRKPHRKAAVIALIATAAIGTTAFAGVKYFQWRLEQEGNYGALITQIPGETAGSTEETVAGNTAGDTQAVYQLSAQPGWLPDGMVQDETMKYSFENNRHRGGFSASWILMDQDTTAESKALLEKNVTASETIKIGDHEGVYLERTGTGFDKIVYLAYPEYGYILNLFGGSDVTREDIIKFLENLEITKTDQVVDTENLLTFSDMAEPETEIYEMQLTATEEEMKNLHQVGDVVLTEGFGTMGTEEWTVMPLQVVVKDVQLLDDISILNSEYVDEDLKNAVDENGNLKKDVIHYMKRGDGITTLDEEIYSEEVDQKLVYATLEYTNPETEELRDICYMVSFSQLIQDEQGYHFYDRALEDGDEKTDMYTTDRNGYGLPEMEYYDVHGGEQANNYIPVLKPGETVTVHVATVIHADEADKLYLMPSASAGAYEFSEEAFKVGYVKAF